MSTLLFTHQNIFPLIVPHSVSNNRIKKPVANESCRNAQKLLYHYLCGSRIPFVWLISNPEIGFATSIENLFSSIKVWSRSSWAPFEWYCLQEDGNWQTVFSFWAFWGQMHFNEWKTVSANHFQNSFTTNHLVSWDSFIFFWEIEKMDSKSSIFPKNKYWLKS